MVTATAARRVAGLALGAVLGVALAGAGHASAQTRTPPPPPPAPKLVGTAWQLVKFQGGDGTTLTPADASKYVIEFGLDGQMAVRIDCNRGRGTWKGSGTAQLQLGPLALTGAQCAPGSLHDRIVKHWPNIRSYVIKDTHLFLSLAADGGIYEFEALPRAKIRKLP
jgi:para-nitrobenzyl esterase